MTVVSPASCFAQVTDRPTGGISIATLHQSIERLETQREELLTQLRELNAPIPFTSLQDAVALCNSKAAVHADASTQTPLTEDELVAAVTMSLAHLRERKSRDETQDHFVDCLDRILQERKLRMDAKLELVTRMSTADGTELDVWNIRLLIPAKNEGQKYAVTIREAFIRVRPVDANQSNPATGQVAEKNAG